MNKHLVFVYGSLRRGNAAAMAVRFPDATFVGTGKVRGCLYDLGAYPALRLNESDTLVTGEIYEINGDTLSKLDQFELTSDYVRREVKVEDGTAISRCWIYIPARDAKFSSDLPLIESGDWIEYLKSRHE